LESPLHFPVSKGKEFGIKKGSNLITLLTQNPKPELRRKKNFKKS